MLKVAYGFFPIVVAVVILLYLFADITTSNQTYHENADRTASKLLLIFLLVILVIFVFAVFVKERRARQTKWFIYVFVASFFLVALLPIVRGAISKKIDSNVFTLSIYPIVFLFLCLFWMLYPLEKINRMLMIVFYYVIMFFCIFFMLYYYFKVQSTPLASLNFRKSIFAHIYLLVGLFPLAFVLFDTKELIFNFIIIFISIIISDKGVPLISFILFAIFLSIEKLSANKKALFIVLGVFFACLTFAVILDYFVLNHLLFNKLFDQSTAIRIDGYKKILDDFKTFSFSDFIIGKGVSAVIELRKLAAHNDFLEYLFDYGIVGLIVLTIFIVSTIICFLKIPKKTVKSNLISLMITLIIFPVLLFSAIFTNTNIFLFVSLGVVFHKFYHSNNIIINAKEIRCEYTEVFI